MPRVTSSIMVACGLIGAFFGVGAGAAFAAPTPSPPVAAGAQPAATGKPVCTIDDPRLVEISGMIATKSGFVVVNDGSDFPDRKKIFFLNAGCTVSKMQSYSGGGPRDPEDMSLAPGRRTIFIADIGDNNKNRDTVALWTMPVNGSAPPVINRLTYPDGKHDAEALLFNGDGTPIIVTKDVGKSGLYSPAGPLKPGSSVPMRKVGEVTVPKTNSSSPLGPPGRLVVTGGATAPDGSRVVLRTYADAFEWDVKDGDVVAALTTGTPRATALPDEPFGEAITYSPDGNTFLTLSETAHLTDGTKPVVLSYVRTHNAEPAPQTAVGPRKTDNRSWFDKLTLQEITYLVAAVGLIGAVLVAVGVFGILRARRAGRTTGADDDSGPRIGRQPGPRGLGEALAAAADPYGYGDDPARGYDDSPRDPDYSGEGNRPAGLGGQRSPGNVYGGGSAGRPGYGGGSSGAVYGGNSSGGAVYGAGSGGDAAHRGASTGGVYGGGGLAEAEDYRGTGDAWGTRHENGYRANGHDGGGPYGQRDARYPDDRYR